MKLVENKKLFSLVGVLVVSTIIGYLVGHSPLAIIGVVLIAFCLSGVVVLRAKYKDWLFYGFPIVGFTLGMLLSSINGV